MEMSMIQFGLCLMVSAGLPLAGVLSALYTFEVTTHHNSALGCPLTPPRGRAARWHLRTRKCPDCAMIVELAVTRMSK